MYRVLLPIDGSPKRATAQAEATARLPAAEEGILATLLHVVDSPEAATETTVEDLTSYRRAKETLERGGIETETEIRVGDPADEILDAADHLGAELIVLGGRRRSPVGALLFGSVSQAVISRAHRPVTVTGDETAPEPSHVCQTCGEKYYTNAEVSVATCRSCGGTHVEVVR